MPIEFQLIIAYCVVMGVYSFYEALVQKRLYAGPTGRNAWSFAALTVCLLLFLSGAGEVEGWKHNVYLWMELIQMFFIVVLFFRPRKFVSTADLPTWVFAMAVTIFQLWILVTG